MTRIPVNNKKLPDFKDRRLGIKKRELVETSGGAFHDLLQVYNEMYLPDYDLFGFASPLWSVKFCSESLQDHINSLAAEQLDLIEHDEDYEEMDDFIKRIKLLMNTYV